MAFGNMGGGTQPQAHAQHVVNLIDLGYNVQATGDAARFDHNQGTGVSVSDVLSLDYYLYEAVGKKLSQWGHTVQSRFGNLEAATKGFSLNLTQTSPYRILMMQDTRGLSTAPTGQGLELRKDGAAVGW